MHKKFNLRKCLPLLVVFVISWMYWIYLIHTSHMLIVFDAKGYEKLGRMIFEQGWLEYFRSGPAREPFYPMIISISLRLEQILGVPFEIIQKVIQMGFLFFTQCFVLVLFSQLRVKQWITFLVTLYVGISPAIVNAGLSLFSEVVAMPFVLLILIFNHQSFNAMQNGNTKRVVFLALGSGLSFVLASFCKGIFQYVFIIFALFFVCVFVHLGFQKRRKECMAAFIFLLIFGFSFQIPIIAFKLMNKKYNGQYAFTNRFTGFLFGNIYKRAQPFSKTMWLTHLASVPGTGVCQRFFSKEECQYAEFQMADYYSAVVLPKLVSDIPADKRDDKVLSLSKDLFLRNIPKQIILLGIESMRMPFWESTSIGFVEYPNAIKKLYHNGIFKNVLRLVVSLLSLLAFMGLMLSVFKKWRLFNSIFADGEIFRLNILILIFLIGYTSLYALFPILTRYALPIAPVYLISIGALLNNLTLK